MVGIKSLAYASGSSAYKPRGNFIKAKGVVIGLKFAGRTDSRGARILHGNRGSKSGGAANASAALLLFALVAGVLLLLIAVFRHALGAPTSAGFWTIFLTPLLVAARFVGQLPPSAAHWLALGVLLLCIPLCALSFFLNCKIPDAIFSAVLAFQLFFVARVFNSFLPRAGAPTWAGLSLAQKLNLALGILLLLSIWLAWVFRPKPPTPYGNSAPSRITRFLKKRRLPSRIFGAILISLAIIAILYVSFLAFWHASTLVTPLRAIFAFLVCDVVYFIGKRFWMRLT